MISILIRRIQPTFSHPTTLRLILIFFSHLYPALWKGVFSSHLPTNIRYALLISPMHTKCSVHPILCDLVTQTIFGEENKLWQFFHYAILSIFLILSPFQIQTFSSASCSQTPSQSMIYIACYTYTVHTWRGAGKIHMYYNEGGLRC